jgi:hypothetical protein
MWNMSSYAILNELEVPKYLSNTERVITPVDTITLTTEGPVSKNQGQGSKQMI